MTNKVKCSFRGLLTIIPLIYFTFKMVQFYMKPKIKPKTIHQHFKVTPKISDFHYDTKTFWGF